MKKTKKLKITTNYENYQEKTNKWLGKRHLYLIGYLSGQLKNNKDVCLLSELMEIERELTLRETY